MSHETRDDTAAEADPDGQRGPHAYLGELQDVDRIAHSLFPVGAIVRLPLVFLPDTVLFPGDELPLRMLSPVSVDAIRAHLSGDNGALAVLCESQQGRFAYGTTVRIEKFSVVGRVASVTGVAKQRFRMKNARCTGALLGEVEILAHPSAPRLPFALSHLRAPVAAPSSHTTLRRLKARQFTGYWGRNAYALFDVQRLVSRIQRTFASSAQWSWFCKASSSAAPVQQPPLPRPRGSMLRFLTEPSEQLDPSVFAYWVAGNLPLERAERLALLRMDCVVRLLRREVEILGQCGDNIYCSGCGAFLAHTSDIFSRTSHGAAGTFVNPGGSVFQILTLREVHPDHVVVDGARSAEDSWFPGYAWSITYCNSCYRHLGWQFDAVAADASLSPARFFGFRRAALTQSAASRRASASDLAVYGHEDDDDDFEEVLGDFSDDDDDSIGFPREFSDDDVDVSPQSGVGER
ncbi:hypothetical protein PybrP1_013150 [[Pythium] brassicae (nom. inval.)]|nr:hypothetical protein PybrP1_013150 [[Pythium] brassicae (nom. inval.)]